MKCKFEQLDRDTLVVRLQGKLRGSMALRFRAALDAFLQNGIGGLVLDLRECYSMDSLGVSVVGDLLRAGLRVAFIEGFFPLLHDLEREGVDVDGLEVHGTESDALGAIMSSGRLARVLAEAC
ncbi:MAG: hypothetical protein HY722_16770 [Planctomycetes bacterium]|nr:hypothetical protein [Planctomycetota bacterium]